ncbi:hypothetical protein NC653_030346 [Populus alba x Populus x berolinensis]|uniref:Uncharacterized protein n=1 Tax=Populus alba x Populus x berolinensis TaxID=444605 RepID=A0AAD6Q035_9ROSI|nr:hypothetical protein NC653_030346 [Populus alba x Populus x berolinensis]
MNSNLQNSYLLHCLWMHLWASLKCFCTVNRRGENLIGKFNRFSEVVELRAICWLQIHGKINTEMLSPTTIHGVYLMVKFAGRAYGLDTLPPQVSEEGGNFESPGKVYLRRRQDKNKQACLSSRTRTLR